MIFADWIAKRPTGPPHGDGVALLDVGIFRAHPARGQDVGQEQHLVILEMIGNDDRPDVGVRHPDIFGLPAGVTAGEMRVSERGAHRVSHQEPRGVHRLCGVAVVAGAELLLLAEEAIATADGERNDDPLTFLQRTFRSDFHNLAHEFVAEDVARPKRRDIAVVQVKVRTADRGRGDAQDGVSRVDDFGIGHGLDAHVVATLPG